MKGAPGKLEFEDKFRRFLRGNWLELVDECLEVMSHWVDLLTEHGDPGRVSILEALASF